MSSNKGQNPFFDAAERNFREASENGLPIFLTDARHSTPLNATPYLAHYDVFREAARSWPGRLELVVMLDTVKVEVEQIGFSVEAILIGGSFTTLRTPMPNDIDCLLFYRLDPDGDPSALAHIQQSARARRVDCRFVPLDGDPLAMLKLTSYFTILYSKRKDHNEIVRSLLLLDCREKL